MYRSLSRRIWVSTGSGRTSVRKVPRGHGGPVPRSGSRTVRSGVSQKKNRSREKGIWVTGLVEVTLGGVWDGGERSPSLVCTRLE